MLLPKELFGDFYDVLIMSKGQYQASRVIVWTSALHGAGHALRLDAAVSPLVFLSRPVSSSAGSGAWPAAVFDYKIELNSGDEMQDLAEAFNDMTAKISLTYSDLEQQVRERSSR